MPYTDDPPARPAAEAARSLVHDGQMLLDKGLELAVAVGLGSLGARWLRRRACTGAGPRCAARAGAAAGRDRSGRSRAAVARWSRP